MKIYAPVKDATGVWAGVSFCNGVGETDDPDRIEWFRSHGYKVPLEDSTATNEVVEPAVEEIKPVDEPELMGYSEPKEKPLDDMTPNELREWMKQNGFGRDIKNIRSKDKLLEIIRG